MDSCVEPVTQVTLEMPIFIFISWFGGRQLRLKLRNGWTPFDFTDQKIGGDMFLGDSHKQYPAE